MLHPSFPIEAELLIPHRRPMRLVDRMLACDGKTGLVEAFISTEGALIDEAGWLEDLALIELLAQAYSCVKGYVDLLEGRPVQQGFLVGIKDTTKTTRVMAGDRLVISVTTLAEFNDFAVASGEIRRSDELVAAGEIKIWIQE